MQRGKMPGAIGALHAEFHAYAAIASGVTSASIRSCMSR